MSRSEQPQTPVQTIADIARLAGVSKSTVSRALNDSPLIGAETKDRIRAIAAEHDFQMSAPARRLSLKQSHAVALVSYAYKLSGANPDAFTLEIMGGISGALAEHGYDLLVVHTRHGDTDWARRYLQSGRVDGFILLHTCTPGELAALTELKAPFVVWGPPPPGRADCCTVSGDNVTGGRIATERLLAGGRTRIAFLGGPAKAREVADRLRGYEEALRGAGIDVDPALVTHADWEHPDETGAEAMHALLERTPDLDGVFANSDLLALGALEALRNAGRRVPDDVAVVGYDDVSIARYSDPPLTTIRQNGPLAGRLLADNLIQHVETGAVTHVSIPAELVARESA